MARKDIQTNVEVSPDEEKLASLLSSIESAKNELEETGSINKKVLSGIEDNKRSLAELKAAKDSLHTEVSEIQEKKEQHLKDLNSAKDALENINVQKTKVEKELADFKTSSEVKKTELQSELKSFQEKIELAKRDASRDSELSKNEKDKLVKEISELNNSLSVLVKQEADQKEKNDNLIRVSDELSRKRDLLNGDLEKNSIEISRQQESLKVFDSKIIEVENDIKNKKLQIEELENAIVGKKAEYKTQETKLFAIKEKEVALDQRERFIRAQYERAGVKYEE